MEDNDGNNFLELNPEDILFSKDVISGSFSDGSFLDSYISIIFNNKIHVQKSIVTKEMRVTIYADKFYTLNNKILYCLRHSETPLIKVKLVEIDKCKEEFLRKFITKNEGRSVRIENEPEIEELQISKMCLQCLPCKHDCKIKYKNGEVEFKRRLSGVKILRLLLDNNLPLNFHLAKYYMTEARKIKLGIY